MRIPKKKKENERMRVNPIRMAPKRLGKTILKEEQSENDYYTS